MHTTLDAPLSDQESKALANFLTKCAHGVAQNLEALDGFFAALIVGPDVVLPSEYLPLILGGENRFDDSEEVSRVLPLLMRHWNTIARTLHRGKVYDLYLLKEASQQHAGADWAHAFMQGVERRYEQWRGLIESKEHGKAIFPMMLLAREKDPELQRLFDRLTGESRDEMVTKMAIGLVDIYRYFRKPPEALLAPVRRLEPATRSGPKVGRNVACPCGSGKKFKVCCGVRCKSVH
jgi:uncharacterized protein